MEQKIEESGLNNLFDLVADYNVSTGGISAGAIAGIVIGSCAFVVLILALLWWRGYIGGDKEDKGKTQYT